MNIKSFCLATLLALPILHGQAWADDATTLRVTDAKGQFTDFLFTEEPVVTFSDDKLVVASDATTIEYPLSEAVTFTIQGTATGITTATTVSNATFRLTADWVEAGGLQPGEDMALYSLNGERLSKTSSDHQGRAQLSMATLPKGIYIIKTNHKAFKFIKK